ncbi:MAG: carbohydrate ABC transporter permease [Verrucomicrobiales bacterium]|jgi:ABC-type glycerol-3-phosphate transport system permease component|nr:carbohydrate ABC transporter permease [Verrucomicrobiales bacterium]
MSDNSIHAVAALQAVGSKRGRDWPKHLVIWLILALQLLPLYMMFQISFKDNTEFLTNPWFPLLPWHWHFDNFVYGVKLIGPYIGNTVFIATVSASCTIFLATLAAYFFARYKMPLSNVLWSIFLVLMLLPAIANIVPLFMLLKSMNLLNTLQALIVIAMAGGQVFNTFILRNFIEDLPKDLFEAAEIDGASHFQQIINIVVPMSAPIIGTLFILSFLGQWNDFMMPLIVLRDRELFTLGVGLVYLNGEYVKQWGQIMSAFMVASIPLIIIFLFCMKLFVRGLAAGAVKG